MTQISNQKEESTVAPNTEAATSNRKTAWIGLGSILSVASLLAIILASLGYGISLAVEAEFGIPHATVFTSAFELLDLSSVAIMAIVNTGTTAVWSVDGFLKLASKIWVLAVFLFGVWALLLLSVRDWRWPVKKFTILRRDQTWLRTPTRGDSWKQFFQSFIWPTIGTFLGFAVLWLVWAAIFSAPVLLAALPSIGYGLGKAHIKEWIIGAETCVPLATREARQKPKPIPQKTLRSVDCVALTKEGKTIAEGLVVLATSSSIVLYNPTTGAARRERTDGVSIEAVEGASWFESPPRP